MTDETMKVSNPGGACIKRQALFSNGFFHLNLNKVSTGLGATSRPEIETGNRFMFSFSRQNSNNLLKPIIYLPANILTFLFAPLNPFSAQNTAIKMACIENILLLFSLIFLIRRFKSVGVPTVRSHESFAGYLLVAVIGYVAFMSQIESNVGTAFRHKSLIYYPLLLVFALLHSTDYKSAQTRND
jgi:hypothetical protein